MRRFFSKKICAFSTSEVLLSSFILTIGLVTIVRTLAGSISYSQINNDVIIASELAQEGVELVRNVRDNDFANGGNGFTSFSVATRNCRIDWNDSSSGLDCNVLQGSASRYYLQWTGGLYQHASTSKEHFSRYIFIDYNIGGGSRALVRSFVYWGNGYMPPSNGDASSCTLLNKCVFSETFLTAWY